MYDIRYFGGDPTDPLGDALGDYLNQPSVQNQFHVGNNSWVMCATLPAFGLLADMEQSVANLLPDILGAYQVMK